jgi:hypothetical protein
MTARGVQGRMDFTNPGGALSSSGAMDAADGVIDDVREAGRMNRMLRACECKIGDPTVITHLW